MAFQKYDQKQSQGAILNVVKSSFATEERFGIECATITKTSLAG